MILSVGGPFQEPDGEPVKFKKDSKVTVKRKIRVYNKLANQLKPRCDTANYNTDAATEIKMQTVGQV